MKIVTITVCARVTYRDTTIMTNEELKLLQSKNHKELLNDDCSPLSCYLDHSIQRDCVIDDYEIHAHQDRNNETN